MVSSEIICVSNTIASTGTRAASGGPQRSPWLPKEIQAVTDAQSVAGVQVWYVSHFSGHHVPSRPRSFDADRAEFAHIRHAALRERSLTTRALLRRALSEVVDMKTKPGEWVFERGDAGKPTLVAGQFPRGSFSCSHTLWASAVAVSTNFEVGIDIESCSFTADTCFVTSFFSLREQRLIGALQGVERAAAVARLWTLKEAYVKLLGTGLADDISKLDFHFASGSNIRHHPETQDAKLYSWQVGCNGEPLAVALAVRGG